MSLLIFLPLLRHLTRLRRTPQARDEEGRGAGTRGRAESTTGASAAAEATEPVGRASFSGHVGARGRGARKRVAAARVGAHDE